MQQLLVFIEETAYVKTTKCRYAKYATHPQSKDILAKLDALHEHP